MEMPITQSTVSTVDPGGDYSNLGGRRALAAWLGCVAGFGLLGNSLVVLAVALYPKLRTTTNMFITSLAVSDMLVCLVVPWIIVGLVSTIGWPLPDETCVLVAILRFTLTGSSVWHLVVIGFNRMILITTCYETYNKVFSRVNTILLLVSTWMIPFMVIVIPFAADVTVLGYDDGPHLCSDLEERPDGSINRTHMVLSATFLSCVPLAITLAFYARIYVFIRRHARRQKKWATLSQAPAAAAQALAVAAQPPAVAAQPPAVVATNGSTTVQPLLESGMNKPTTAQLQNTIARGEYGAVETGMSVEGDQSKDVQLLPSGRSEIATISVDAAGTSRIVSTNSRNPTAAINDQSRQAKVKRSHDLETRITKNTFLVVVALIGCLIPYGILILTDIGPEGVPMALSTLILNTCLNPLIYGTKHPQFRVAIKSILSRKWSRNISLTTNSVGPASQSV